MPTTTSWSVVDGGTVTPGVSCVSDCTLCQRPPSTTFTRSCRRKSPCAKTPRLAKVALGTGGTVDFVVRGGPKPLIVWLDESVFSESSWNQSTPYVMRCRAPRSFASSARTPVVLMSVWLRALLTSPAVGVKGTLTSVLRSRSFVCT